MYVSYNWDPEINFVHYIELSTIEGCPLSGVSLYRAVVVGFLMIIQTQWVCRKVL